MCRVQSGSFHEAVLELGCRADQRPVGTAFRAEAGNEAQGHHLCGPSALTAAPGGTVFSLGLVSGRKYFTWITLLCSKAKKSPTGKLILYFIFAVSMFFLSPDLNWCLGFRNDNPRRVPRVLDRRRMIFRGY